MKKLFLFSATFIFLMSPAFAESLKVSALQSFSTESPSDTLKVIVVERMEFKNGIVFEDGAILKGNILDVKPPKRAKLNASFKFQPVEYTYNGKTQIINDNDFVGKYASIKTINKGDVAVSAAATAGGLILQIPGLSQGVSFVKGIIKNNDENRLKSGVVQVYKDSPLSYVEEGKEIEILKDEVFVLKFKTDKDDVVHSEELPVNTAPKVSEPLPDPETEHPDAAVTDSRLTPYNPDDVFREVQLLLGKR